MTTWGNICRVCSSTAGYEVFGKIPTYLHANTNEFMDWQKPINELLEETTGLKVTKDDGLPHNICAICISYLKHACIFRQQTINNALSLKIAGFFRERKQNNMPKEGKDKDENNLLVTAEDLEYVEGRQVDANTLLNNCLQNEDKVCKRLLNNGLGSSSTTQESVEQQMRYLNLLFNKNANAGLKPKYKAAAVSIAIQQQGSSDDAEADYDTETSSEENVGRKQNFFSYQEKNFEEDDIMDLGELRDNVTVNVPESYKERKCRACFRRFMFEDSYNEHLDTCIEHKLLLLVEELNNLLDIRRAKAISPHEFIRRTIFCLRKTCEWLKVNCDQLLPDLKQSGEVNNSIQCRESNSQKEVTSDNLPDFIDRREPHEETAGICNLLFTPTPSTPPLVNNILHEIERSEQSRSRQQRNLNTDNQTQLKKPIAVLATNASNISSSTTTPQYSNIPERLTFLQKLQQAASQTPTVTSTSQLQQIDSLTSPIASKHAEVLLKEKLLQGVDQNSPTLNKQMSAPFDPMLLQKLQEAVNRSPTLKAHQQQPRIQQTPQTVNKQATNTHRRLLKKQQQIANQMSAEMNQTSAAGTTPQQRRQETPGRGQPTCAVFPVTSLKQQRTPARNQQICAVAPVTPQISVRKDLLDQRGACAMQELHITPTPINFAFSARCPPCNEAFESLTLLEIHNARCHNTIKNQGSSGH